MTKAALAVVAVIAVFAAAFVTHPLISDPGLAHELIAMTREGPTGNGPIGSGFFGSANATPDDLAAKFRDFRAKQNARLAQILEAHGWPRISMVGREGSEAAWRLTQAADEAPALQKRGLELMQRALKDVRAEDIAALADHIATISQLPQPYGSNWTCGAHGIEPITPLLGGRVAVDGRRAGIGLGPSVIVAKEMLRRFNGCRFEIGGDGNNTPATIVRRPVSP